MGSFPYFLLNYARQINQEYPPCVSQAPVLAPLDLDHPLVQTWIQSVFQQPLLLQKHIQYNPRIWPMCHIGFRLGLGSGSECFRQRRILRFIHQQSDDRWVEAKGKTSSRLDGTLAICSVCFKGRRVFECNSACGSRELCCLLG